MQRARIPSLLLPSSLAAALGLGGLGCAGGEATSSTGPDLGGSSGSDDTSPGEGPDGTTTTLGTGNGSSSSEGSADGTSTTEPTGDTSTGECPAGTETCPCDRGACEGELVCLGDVCQTTMCDGDVFEPNDDEADAFFLGMIDDSDGNGGIVSASLHHPGDVDWFSYQGDDDFTANVDPARELVSSAGLRLCKFLECDNGLAQTEFECPAGTQYALSPMARPGCCASGGIALPDLNCTGVSEDNAMVYIRVDMPEEACVTYSVAYHY